MTASVSLAARLALPGARPDDRGAKGGDGKGQGFADTLAGAVGNRPVKPMPVGNQQPQEPRLWLLDPAMRLSEAALSFETWRIPAADGEEPAVEEPVAEGLDTAESPAEEPELLSVAPLLADEEDALAEEKLTEDNRTGDGPREDGSAAAPPAEAKADDAEAVDVAAPPAVAPQPQPVECGEPRVAVEQALAGWTEAPPPRRAADQPAPARQGEAVPNPKPAETIVQPPQEARPAPSAPSVSAHPTRAEQPADARPASASLAMDERLARQAPAPEPAPRDRAARQTPAPAKQMPEQPMETGGPRVTVLAAATVPAPAPAGAQVLGPTAAGLVSEIAADPGWRATQQAEAAARAARPGAVHSLRIQLQPVELGMVTARLTRSGAQMSIEIQVESNDARQRLSQDSDQIVRALKAAGIEVDKVTIQQAPQASAPANAQQQQGAPRDMGSQQQASAEREAGGRGERGSSGGRDEGARHGTAETTADRAGGGLYI